MKTNFRMAVILVVALCGFAVQLTSQAQSASSSQNKIAGSAQSALVEYPAIEGPETAAVKPATESTSETAASSTASAKKDTAPSDSTSTTPGTASVTLRNEAVIKELAEMKKQFAQMQDEMKARIAKLESELDTDGATGDSVSAEHDAGVLRSAETGETNGSLAVGQATTPLPAAAPPAPEI